MSILSIPEQLIEIPTQASRSEFVGPLIPNRLALWQLLTDLSQWPSWVPELKGQQAIEKCAEIGRGTKLVIGEKSVISEIEIMYWEAPRKIILKLSQVRGYTAYQILVDQKADLLLLSFSGEFDAGSWQTMISPLTVRKEQKRLSAFANSFHLFALKSYSFG